MLPGYFVACTSSTRWFCGMGTVWLVGKHPTDRKSAPYHGILRGWALAGLQTCRSCQLLSFDSCLPQTANISVSPFPGTILQRRRGKLSVAFRFGTPVADEGGIGDSAPARIRKTCEEALQACGLDAIDLFYQERPDATTPIDQTMAELKVETVLPNKRFLRCMNGNP